MLMIDTILEAIPSITSRKTKGSVLSNMPRSLENLLLSNPTEVLSKNAQGLLTIF